MLELINPVNVDLSHLHEECEVCEGKEKLVRIMSADSYICMSCLNEDIQNLRCTKCGDETNSGYISVRVGKGLTSTRIHYCDCCYNEEYGDNYDDE